jgi:uncharacterized lipoprotein YddW (UPF0748 family)
LKNAILAGLAALIVSGGASAGSISPRLAVSGAPVAAAAPTVQFRGLWVNAWGKGIKTPEEAEKLVETAKSANFNALLVQVRKRGDVYYASDIEPRASDIAPGFDPLAFLLEKAHAAGIQVHAWVVVYPAWSDTKHTPPQGHVLRLHPDWATYNKNGRRMNLHDGDEGVFLDPGLPEVRDYLAGVAAELVRKYPVDGLHLDYIRYPGRQWGYNPEAVRRFKTETGHTPSGAPKIWDQWRRDQVTALVAKISQEIEEIRPATRLSAAVFPTPQDSYVYRLQDWDKWTREGLVDFVAPMNYATTRTRFASRSAALMSRGKSRPVYMGVGGGNKSEEAVLNQMQLLQKSGAPGIVLYHYDGNSPHFWKALKNRLFRRPALVPALPWKASPQP